jgi:type VI secretion system protein ImpF
MAELTVRERLQPSLLDRLTDDEPDKKVESRDRRVMSVERLRESVLRDLSWLLNTGNLAQVDDLTDDPEVAHSVLNYGTPDLAGRNITGRDLSDLEESLRQAIVDFEPRILPDSLKVNAIVDETQMTSRSLVFEIEGMLWSQPLPMRLLLKTVVDLETGQTEIAPQSGR